MNTLKKLILEDALLYKCVLIVMGFFYAFPFTAAVSGSVIKGMLLWGAAMILYDLIKNRECLKKKEYFILYAFVFLVGVSTLFSFGENFSRNVVYILYLVAAAVVPFVVRKEKSRERLLTELRVITSVLIAITLLVSFVSFVIFCTGFQGSVNVGETEYILGFVEGRLYGIMGNPNSTAHLAFISIIFSLLGLFLQNKKILKRLCITNLVLQILILSVSNSRSALVCVCAAAAVYVFFLAKQKIQKKEAAAVALSLVIALGGAVGVYAGVRVVNKAMGYVPSIYSFVEYQLTYTEPETVEGETPKKKKPVFKAKDTDREFKTEDTSNGRVEIWGAAVQVAKENPLFGVGSENIASYVLPHLSESTQKNAPGLAGNMHNVYLQILVGNGVFALLAFLGFFVFVMLKALICLFRAKDSKEKRLLLTLFCGVLGLLAENLFDSNIIGFMCFVIVPIFWTMCGYMASLSERIKEQEVK